MTRGTRHASPSARWGLALLALIAASLVMSPGRAAAQAPQAPPAAYRGLFENVDAVPGTRARSAPPRPAFSWSSELFGAYEHSAPASARSTGEGPAGDARFAAADLSMAARRRGQRLTLHLAVQAQPRRYQDWRGLQLDQQRVGLDADVALTRATRLSIAGRADYSAQYAVRVPFTGGDAAAASGSPSLALEFSGVRSVAAGSSVAVAHQVNRRTRVSSALAVNRVTFLDRDSTVMNWRAAGELVRRVRGDASLEVRYALTRSDTRGEALGLVMETHELEATIGWSAAAGTRVALGVIPGLKSRSDMPGRDDEGGVPAFTAHMGALARVDHHVGRSWRVGLAWQRAFYSDERFVQPAFVQTASARLDGRLARWLTLAASGAWSSGQSSTAASPRAGGSLGYSMRWDARTSRSTSIYAEYQDLTYAGFDLAASGTAPSGQLNRRALRFGVAVRTPAR
jgi:hypothetical protein